MAFKMFNNTGSIFMIMSHVRSWQHQFTTEKMMDIEETTWSLLSVWKRKSVLALIADGMLSKLDKHETKESS